MSQTFITVVNMSISAGWLVLALLLCRLLLKKAPKWITVLLWGVAALRLVMPFSVESVFSLIPNRETISPDVMLDAVPEIDSGIPVINSTLNPVIGEVIAQNPGDSANPLQVIVPVAAVIWMAGMAALIIYTVVSYLRLKRSVSDAVLLYDNVYQSENAVSPFVLGVFRPAIYIPYNMDEGEARYVISHEKAHIRRKDHIWKPLGFLLLTVHWFNPLIWLGYILLCRDIELACDEKVIKELDRQDRAEYSQALLSCSVKRRMIAACPLAFGEVGVKGRIMSVLNYKKPALWIIIASAVIIAVLAVCFLTDPINNDLYLESGLRAEINESIIDRFATPEGENRALCTDFDVIGKRERGSKTTLYVYLMYAEYNQYGRSLKSEYAFDTPSVITYKTDAKGKIQSIDIWTPESGEDYVKSIKQSFPWRLQSRALDFADSAYKREEACLRIARLHFGLPSVTLSPSASEEILREKYPHFFGLDDKNGLAVYIWQLAKGQYSCYLKPANEEMPSLMLPPEGGAASISEMRTILLSYGISREMVYLRPRVAMWSSYAYEINDDYIKELEILFWSEITGMDFSRGFDSMKFDIDGDGRDELCTLTPGNTSGLFTFVFEVIDLEQNIVEYESVIYSQPCEPSFITGDDGITRVKAAPFYGQEEGEIHIYDISLSDGGIILTENGIHIGDIID